MPRDKADAPIHYWDACVFLSYADEMPGRVHIVEALLDEAERGDVQIVTSHLSIVEAAFVRQDCDYPTRPTKDETVKRIDRLWAPPSKILMAEMSEALAYKARELIHDARQKSATSKDGVRQLKPHDAIHLASAHLVGAVKVLSYDDRMIKIGKLLGFNIDEPTAPDPPKKLDDKTIWDAK